MTAELHRLDVHYAVTRLPKPVRALLKRYSERVFLAGGYLRSIILGEPIQDIDLFVRDRAAAKAFALVLEPNTVKHYTTENAITLRSFHPVVQLIHRWSYLNAESAIADFDFTVAQASIWYEKAPDGKGAWRSVCADDYYQDLAARRLRYTAPRREEELGGSLLRVVKFLRRGYNIRPEDLSQVLARLLSKVHESALTHDEEGTARVLVSLLREVDPLLDSDRILSEDDEEDVDHGA